VSTYFNLFQLFLANHISLFIVKHRAQKINVVSFPTSYFTLFIIIMLSDRKSTPLVNDTLAGHTTEHVSELIPKVLITKN
jgi:hypothetical protein